MNKRTALWIPAIAVPAVVVAGAFAVPAMANASVKLPPKSAAQIVTLATKASAVSFSGTIQTTADLGLPDLSALQGAGGSGGSSNSVSDLLAQLSGTHSANVFVDGDKSRVQTLDDLAERDVYRDGNSIWAYDSKTDEAVHATVPTRSATTGPLTQDSPFSQPTWAPQTSAPQTPQQIVDQLLTKIGPTTSVTTTDNVRVAKQKAYEIVLTPKDTTTLVGNVTVAIDAATGLPLKASITAAGQKSAAYSVEFTSIRYSAPSASTFTFTPPKGAKVTQIPATGDSHVNHPLTQQSATDKAERQAGKAKAQAAVTAAAPKVIGSGWSTIVAATLPAAVLSGETGEGTPSTGQGAAALQQLLTKVDGGSVLQTALVSIYVTDAGRVYLGAVPASALEAAAAQN